MKKIGIKLLLTLGTVASVHAANLGVLEPGNYANIVCSNQDWRVAVYSNGDIGGVELVIDYRGQTIAQNGAKYAYRADARGVSYRVDAGMGHAFTLRFRDEKSMYGRGDFRAFGIYDIPSLRCEIGD